MYIHTLKSLTYLLNITFGLDFIKIYIKMFEITSPNVILIFLHFLNDVCAT